MHLSRLGTFTLGVIVTAASVGAVSFANAAGDATLKACANKTTGVMRYISKGSCKKTEIPLAWNQTGIQGAVGATGTTGARGETGAAGTKGDAGIAGSNGTAGTNGQNYYAVDATGKTLGPVLGTHGYSVDVLIDNLIWTLQRQSNQIDSSESGSAGRYSDASCAIPYMTIAVGNATSPQGMTVDYGQNSTWDTTDKAYKVSGSQVSWTGKTIYYFKFSSVSDSLCTALTDSEKSGASNVSNRFFRSISKLFSVEHFSQVVSTSIIGP